MKVKDLRLNYVIYSEWQKVRIYDQIGNAVFRIRWGKQFHLTKLQAIAIANLLCARFNAGQEGK